MTSIKLFRPETFRGSFDADENVNRSLVFDLTVRDGDYSNEEWCELFFHATNAPEELVRDHATCYLIRTYWKQAAHRDKLYTPSTGDVVEVNGTSYLCEPVGWKKLK